MQTYDVIVAGLGAMGSAAAYALAGRGMRVLGLDRFTPPHPWGSSHGESRIIREAYFEHPSYVPLVQRAYRAWEALEAESGHPLLVRTGAVMIGDPESELIRGATRSAEQHELPHERLSAAELRARFPLFTPGERDVGVYEPRAGALRVEACIEALLDGARRRGAELRFGESLQEWTADDEGVRVTTSAGQHQAETLVLAIGAWLPELVPELPLQVERQVMFWFQPSGSAERFRPDNFPVFLWELASDRMFYGLPDLGSGIKVARHHGGENTTTHTVRREVSEADEAEVHEFLSVHLPAVDGTLLRSSVCLYTNTPDGHFLIDRHLDSPAVWLVSPCSGHGFKFAPAVGDGLAEGIATGSVPRELAAFGVERLLGADRHRHRP